MLGVCFTLLPRKQCARRNKGYFIAARQWELNVLSKNTTAMIVIHPSDLHLENKNSGCYINDWHLRFTITHLHAKFEDDSRSAPLNVIFHRYGAEEMLWIIIITSCPFRQVKYKFNLKNTCPSPKPQLHFYLPPKEKELFFVLKVVCPQYTFSLPDSGNCYFLIFRNACPNLTFTCPGQLGKCLCSTLKNLCIIRMLLVTILFFKFKEVSDILKLCHVSYPRACWENKRPMQPWMTLRSDAWSWRLRDGCWNRSENRWSFYYYSPDNLVLQ